MKQKGIFIILTAILLPLGTVIAQNATIETESIVHNVCYGASDGEWHLDTANFVGDLHIEFSSGQQDTLDLWDLSSGEYWYWAVDLSNPSDTLRDTITIQQPSPVRMDILAEELPHCYDGNDGEVVVDVYGGVGNYYGLYHTSDTTFTIERLNDFRFKLSGLNAGWTGLKLKDYNFHCYREDSVYLAQPFDGPQSAELDIQQPSCKTCPDGEIRLKSVENAYDDVVFYYDGTWYEDPYYEGISALTEGKYKFELKSLYDGGYCILWLEAELKAPEVKYDIEFPDGFSFGDMFDITLNGISISNIPELQGYELTLLKENANNWGSQIVLHKTTTDSNVLPLSLETYESGAYIVVLKLPNGQVTKKAINVFNN